MSAMVAIIGLSWATFLCFFLYRQARDKHLNYKAGSALRAQVVRDMSKVLADPTSTTIAIRFADLLLSLVYDRKLRSSLVAAPAVTHPLEFPAELLGDNSAIIKRSVELSAISMMLETRFGNAMRKFLEASGCEPLVAAEQMTALDGNYSHTNRSAESGVDVLGMLVKLPSGQFLENVIEGQLESCVA